MSNKQIKEEFKPYLLDIDRRLSYLNETEITVSCDKYEAPSGIERSGEYTYRKDIKEISFYSYEVSHHNGDHYNCINSKRLPNDSYLESVLKRMLETLSKSCMKKAERQARKEEEEKIIARANAILKVNGI